MNNATKAAMALETKRTRKPKPPTNIAFVRDLMEHSNYGALAQLFVLDALDKWSKLIASKTPEELDTGLVSGEGWKGVAQEIQNKIQGRF